MQQNLHPNRVNYTLILRDMATKPINAVPNIQNAEGIGTETAFSSAPSFANKSSKWIA